MASSVQALGTVSTAADVDDTTTDQDIQSSVDTLAGSNQIITASESDQKQDALSGTFYAINAILGQSLDLKEVIKNLQDENLHDANTISLIQNALSSKGAKPDTITDRLASINKLGLGKSQGFVALQGYLENQKDIFNTNLQINKDKSAEASEYRAEASKLYTAAIVLACLYFVPFAGAAAAGCAIAGKVMEDKADAAQQQADDAGAKCKEAQGNMSSASQNMKAKFAKAADEIKALKAQSDNSDATLKSLSDTARGMTSSYESNTNTSN